MTDYHPLIVEVANHYGLDAALLVAQVDVESGGDPWAFRYEDAFFDRYLRGKPVASAAYGPLAACSYGLLQVLYQTARELGFTERPERLFDPRVGLTWGAQYLVKCNLRAKGDARLGLQFYNGTGRQAEQYADRVLSRAGRS